jgi:hypothetical protein
MSKKLLKEATVRKFMKLANIASLSSPFLKEMEYKRDEDLNEEEEMELDAELPMPADDAPEADLGGDDHEELLKRVVNAVAQELDVDVDIEGGDAPMGDEPPMDEPPMDDSPMGDEPPMGDEFPMGDEEEDEEEEDLMAEAIMSLLDKSGIQVVDDRAMTEALVKKVAARVARRLLKESL